MTMTMTTITHLHLQQARALASLVQQALLDEVTLTPKPGLVDLRSRGAHLDLNWALMCHSAVALRPTFEAMAEAGLAGLPQDLLRQRIGQLGRDGEAAMFAATGGVNTHRGAIWALGLLITAAGQQLAAGQPLTPAKLAARAGALARIKDAGAPARTGNKGEAARLRYHVGGASGQAQADFPHVMQVGLPALQDARRQGATETAARLQSLLAIVAELDDTCVLARGGPDALSQVQAGASAVLAAGGLATSAGSAALMQLEHTMLALNVSPGGAADLLAATLLLDRLQRLQRLQHHQPDTDTEDSHGTT